ncbi:MAG: DUF1963 domain-containing protein [Tidjanibacter sp.]|nr:DUF1963 domain-containing protein [Tidjanibacter sp.]
MAIKITTNPTDHDLVGKSHWWGFADLPDGVEYPCRKGGEVDDEGTEETLTFICQLRLEDVAPLDTEGALPREGMLWFFADLDYFLGDLEAPCEGTGEWPEGSYKVIYSPHCNNLNTHKVCWADGESACMPAEQMEFEQTEPYDGGHKLLGYPLMDEWGDTADGELRLLLQVDSEDRWGLRFFDMGTLCFLIGAEDLAARRFDRAKVMMYSS